MEEKIGSIYASLVSSGVPVPPTLREFQVDAMALVMAGQSVVLKVPTGAGKTYPVILINSFTDGKNQLYKQC